MRRLSAALALLAWPGAAVAHADHADAPNIGWTLGPEIVVPLLLCAALYAIGWARLGRRSRRSRARADWLAFAGWGLLAAALVSPLHEAGELSFALHMVEHEIIMLPATLLLVMAKPGPVLLWGLPRRARLLLAPLIRASLWRTLAAPVTATAIQAAVLILWHMPALFGRALRSEGWHIAQHLSFVIVALLFWWAMLHPRGAGGRFAAALCLFVTSVIGGGLGALMAFAASPWYPGYAALGTNPLGLSAQADQQLAGLVMWVPGGAFHAAAAVIMLLAGLRSAPERLADRVGERRQAA